MAKIYLPEGRLSYVKLANPEKDEKTGELIYECTLVVDYDGDDWREDPKFQEAIDLFYNTAMNKFGTLDNIHRPMKDPTKEVLETNPWYEGKCIIPLRSRRIKPDIAHIVGNKAVTLDDWSRVYSGCWAIPTCTAYAYDYKGKKGVSFGLATLCKTRDDEPLGAHHDAERDFDDLDVSKFVDNSKLFGKSKGSGSRI